MKCITPTRLGLATACLCLCCTASANAATVWSANVYRDNSTVTDNPLGASETAGVVAEDNWTNVGFAKNQSGDITANVASNDSTGALSLVIKTGQWDGWHSNLDHTDGGDEKMLDTFVKRSSFSVDITGLAAGAYDFYYYTFVNDNTGNDMSVTLDATTYWGETHSPSTFSSYQRATATTQAAATSGNHYVLFEDVTVTGTSDVTTASFSVSSQSSALSGVQVVLVPEPASLALLGLGVLLMAPRRRRHV